jgi:SnoaL-like polyketide cyclase
MPDLYAAEQDIIAENDLVVVRLVVTAMVKGSLLGAPADGKPVRWDAVDIYRVTDGKISEEWPDDGDAAIMPRSAPSTSRGRPDLPGQQPAGFRNSASQSCLGFESACSYSPDRPRGQANAGSAPGGGQRKGRPVSSLSAQALARGLRDGISRPGCQR